MRTYKPMAGLLLAIFSFLVPSVQIALAQNACATAANLGGDSWIAITSKGGQSGEWQLSQSPSGSISGQFRADADVNCPANENYTISGQYSGNGSFTVTATYTGSDHIDCVASLTMSGTITAPGCNQAAMSWTNSQGAHGTATWSHACYVPSGEATNVFDHFGSPPSFAYPTSAVFHINLPNIYNWGGRTIAETFPSWADNCYFSGSAYSKLAPTAAPPTTLSSGQIAYSDVVGAPLNVVNYYREHNRAPCAFTNQQQVTIDCPTNYQPPNPVYQTNAQSIGVGLVSVTDQRGSAFGTEIIGTPAPPITIISILNNLLLNQLP